MSRLTLKSDDSESSEGCEGSRESIAQICIIINCLLTSNSNAKQIISVKFTISKFSFNANFNSVSKILRLYRSRYEDEPHLEYSVLTNVFVSIIVIEKQKFQISCMSIWI